MLNLNFKKQPISYANVWVAENVLDLSQARDHEKSFNRCTANSFKPYDNLLEKLLLDDWSKFDNQIYSLMQKFCSFEFTKAVEKTCGMSDLMPDVGLHGAGLFLQKNGWHLNPHIDYKVHPKLGFERKVSLLFLPV